MNQDGKHSKWEINIHLNFGLFQFSIWVIWQSRHLLLKSLNPIRVAYRFFCTGLQKHSVYSAYLIGV